jgi:hypothetical protein
MTRYHITYAEKWNQQCPNCDNPIVLTRPDNEPHRNVEATCQYCGHLIAGYIHADDYAVSRHVFDLLKD